MIKALGGRGKRPRTDPMGPGGRRRDRAKICLAAVAAMVMPAVLVVASSEVAGAATNPTAPSASTAAASPPSSAAAAMAGVPVPGIPTVDPSITSGQDPVVLLARAIALINTAQQTAPLQNSVSSLRAGVDANMVRASQANAAEHLPLTPGRLTQTRPRTNFAPAPRRSTPPSAKPSSPCT